MFMKQKGIDNNTEIDVLKKTFFNETFWTQILIKIRFFFTARTLQTM